MRVAPNRFDKSSRKRVAVCEFSLCPVSLVVSTVKENIAIGCVAVAPCSRPATKTALWRRLVRNCAQSSCDVDGQGNAASTSHWYVTTILLAINEPVHGVPIHSLTEPYWRASGTKGGKIG